MPTPDLHRRIAASVGAPAALAPVLPELFTGIRSLGSMPGVVVRLLREAGLGPRDAVLDLACGKGAIAVAIARGLGGRVIGVDGAASFVADGIKLAASAGLSHRVTILRGDVRRLPHEVTAGRFDASLMIGLYPLVRAAMVLRLRTKRGGVYLVDDCFLDPRRGRTPKGLAGTPTLEQCEASIAAIGDSVERVHVPSPGDVRRLNERLYARLVANAPTVMRQHPSLRPAVRDFLKVQRRSGELLTGPVRPAIWVIRRR